MNHIGKWSRSRKGRTSWAASSGKRVSVPKGGVQASVWAESHAFAWIESGHGETSNSSFAGSDSNWTSGDGKSRKSSLAGKIQATAIVGLEGVTVSQVDQTLLVVKAGLVAINPNLAVLTEVK